MATRKEELETIINNCEHEAVKLESESKNIERILAELEQAISLITTENGDIVKNIADVKLQSDSLNEKIAENEEKIKNARKMADGFADDFECSSAVMDNQALHILAKNHLRLVIFANTCHIQKKRTATSAFVVILKTQALPRHTKRLTRESRKTNIERGNIFFINFRYVSGNLKIVIEIGFICRLCLLIPFANKYRTDIVAERPIKTESNTADAGK